MTNDATKADTAVQSQFRATQHEDSGALAFLTTPQLLNAVPDAVSVCDASGRIVALNDAWTALIGPVGREAALNAQASSRGQVEILHPDGTLVPPDELAINLALRGQTVRQSEIVMRLPDGKTLWVQTNAHPIRDASGTVIGAIATSHDVTKLRVLQEHHALQRRELEQKIQELEMIISSMADGVLITDSEGQTMLTNPAFDSMFSPGSAQLPARVRFDNLRFRSWDGHPLAYEQTPVPRALSGDQFNDEEFLVRGADGRDLFERVSGGPLLDSARNILGSVILVRNVTHLKEADRKRNEFVSLIAHELRTPVTLIRGFSQLLIQSLDDSNDTEMLRRLRIIDRRSEQLSRLITELMDVTRLELGEMAMEAEPLEYRSLVATVSQDMAAFRTGRNVQVRGPERVMVMGDSLRLQQVLINLIDNAFTHGPPSTSVRIILRRDGDMLVTRVHDDGSPIPSTERERIFEKFYQVDDGNSALHRGIGLGLFISRQIVQAHGGRIWVEDGEHNSFAFSLPLAQGHSLTETTE